MTMRQPVNKGKGAAIQWLRAHVGHVGADCLQWPFSTSRGHANLSLNGKVLKACRLMCEFAHGNPPTPKHEAAHSCGRGHLGCINPQHLSWKTRTENQHDRREHGTAGKAGWSHVRYKLTIEQVAEIRAIGPSKTKEELGRIFNVTPANIAKILRGESWPDGKRRFGGVTFGFSR